MGKGNLIVTDDDFTRLAQNDKIYANLLEDKYQNYIDAVALVCANALPSGQTAENLQAFLQTAQQLKGQFRAVTEDIATYITAYVADIDAADKAFY